MLLMSRTENAKGKIQGFSLIEVRNGLKSAVLRVAPHVERPGRPLEYGLMLSRIAAWYLVQDQDAQIQIAQQGDAIIEELRQQDDPGPPLDGERANEMGARHPGPKAQPAGYVGKVDPPARLIDAGSHAGEPDLAPSVWKHHTDRARRAESGGGLGDGLKGDDVAVGKRNRPPRGK